MYEIGAVGGDERVKKGCSACDKGGRLGGRDKAELVVRRHGRKAGRGARVSSLYAEMLVGGRYIPLQWSVIDKPGKTPAQMEGKIKIRAVGMRQSECECVNEHGYGKSIVVDDRMGRCFVEYAF